MSAMHPLVKFIEEKGYSRSEFARRAQMSESHLSLILAGKRGVSLGLAARIERATNQRVKALDMLPQELV